MTHAMPSMCIENTLHSTDVDFPSYQIRSVDLGLALTCESGLTFDKVLTKSTSLSLRVCMLQIRAPRCTSACQGNWEDAGDALDGVSVGRAAVRNALAQDAQVLVQQHDAGRLLCHIRAWRVDEWFGRAQAGLACHPGT